MELIKQDSGDRVFMIFADLSSASGLVACYRNETFMRGIAYVE
ncbi:hypothetical protein SAMN05216402_1552 [Nitrosospira multiformis]|uniref:Uncharacterized protein n=1 Tax=Nitrosospira multiformis TaxID=1231 RepID=A0ABY0TCB8_9PROT|nr:hypothetical protein SAMN05216402_1552 [Nitrosospira multiformis]